MSVIHDCRPGDGIVCLEKFHASPDGEPFSWDASRVFRVGERLRYVGFRQEPKFADRPYGWLVIFETADGKHHAATQTYFVTEDCWRGIKRYLARRFMHEPKRKFRLSYPRTKTSDRKANSIHALHQNARLWQ